jgi:hypothetical protein
LQCLHHANDCLLRFVVCGVPDCSCRFSWAFPDITVADDAAGDHDSRADAPSARKMNRATNVWLGPDGTEMSIDLMRYHRDAPKEVMEALFGNLFV